MSNRRLSYYNFIHKFKDGRALVWNTYTGSIFLIGVSEFCEFEKQAGKWFEENKHYFIDGGILVDTEEQQQQIDFIFDERKRAVKETKTIYYTILPTTACNARCHYCFEKDNEVITMKEDCLDNIVSFIVRESTPFENISITWFGGEPLLFKNYITKITNQLSIKCKNKKISSDLITNGILFDSDSVKSAKNDWFVENVQISLDGTEKNYERIKNYINIPHAYSIVIQNIQKLIDSNISVNIRLNIDKSNMYDMLTLIDELHEKFGNKIWVYAYPIFETKNNKENIVPNNEIFLCLGEIFKKLKDLGYREKTCVFKEFIPWYCASTLPHNFVIMPDGKLLKCQSEIGQKLFLGDVEHGVINLSRNNEFSIVDLDEDCIKCCYLPICQGGCLAPVKCVSKIERCCLEKYYLHELIEKYYLEELDE